MSLIELSWTAKNHLGTFFALFFGRVWNQKVQKCQYLAQNDYKCIFWVQIWPFLGQNSWFQREEAKGLVPTQRKTTYAPCLHRFLAGHETKWAKNVNIWAKISVLGHIWPVFSKNFILHYSLLIFSYKNNSYFSNNTRFICIHFVMMNVW